MSEEKQQNALFSGARGENPAIASILGEAETSNSLGFAGRASAFSSEKNILGRHFTPQPR